MESKWAEENLQTIRTLMERSAIYRRALAPIMIYLGLIGLVGAAIEPRQNDDSPLPFVLYWYGVAAVALIGATLLVRRQALRDHEPFWSPPARRVTQAMFPPLLAGFVLGLFILGLVLPALANFYGSICVNVLLIVPYFLPAVWGVLYGCALCSAGFFMPRGVKLFGLFLIVLSLISFLLLPHLDNYFVSPAGNPKYPFTHYAMGLIFGLSHLIYGLYLYATEKRKTAA